MFDYNSSIISNDTFTVWTTYGIGLLLGIFFGILILYYLMEKHRINTIRKSVLRRKYIKTEFIAGLDSRNDPKEEYLRIKREIFKNRLRLYSMVLYSMQNRGYSIIFTGKYPVVKIGDKYIRLIFDITKGNLKEAHFYKWMDNVSASDEIYNSYLNGGIKRRCLSTVLKSWFTDYVQSNGLLIHKDIMVITTKTANSEFLYLANKNNLTIVGGKSLNALIKGEKVYLKRLTLRQES